MKWPAHSVAAEALLLSLLLAPTLSLAEGIPIVGLDKSHRSRSMRISEAEYNQVFQDMLVNVSAATLPTLEARERESEGKTKWLLRNVCVGLGLEISVGLGPIWSLSLAPRIRLGFSNSTHPKIPD